MAVNFFRTALEQRENQVPNPIKKYINYSSKEQDFSYWDKEKEERVKIKKPFIFVPIDEPYGYITGQKSKAEGYFKSNAIPISEMRKKMFNVRVQDNHFVSGYWISDREKKEGLKFEYPRMKFGLHVYAIAVRYDGKSKRYTPIEIVRISFDGGHLTGGVHDEKMLENAYKSQNLPNDYVNGWGKLKYDSYKHIGFPIIMSDKTMFVEYDNGNTSNIPLLKMAKEKNNELWELLMPFTDKYTEYKTYLEKRYSDNSPNPIQSNNIANSEVDNIPLPDESQAPPEDDSDDLPF